MAVTKLCTCIYWQMLLLMLTGENWILMRKYLFVNDCISYSHTLFGKVFFFFTLTNSTQPFALLTASTTLTC